MTGRSNSRCWARRCQNASSFRPRRRAAVSGVARDAAAARATLTVRTRPQLLRQRAVRARRSRRICAARHRPPIREMEARRSSGTRRAPRNSAATTARPRTHDAGDGGEGNVRRRRSPRSRNACVRASNSDASPKRLRISRSYERAAPQRSRARRSLARLRRRHARCRQHTTRRSCTLNSIPRNLLDKYDRAEFAYWRARALEARDPPAVVSRLSRSAARERADALCLLRAPAARCAGDGSRSCRASSRCARRRSRISIAARKFAARQDRSQTDRILLSSRDHDEAAETHRWPRSISTCRFTQTFSTLQPKPFPQLPDVDTTDPDALLMAMGLLRRSRRRDREALSARPRTRSAHALLRAEPRHRVARIDLRHRSDDEVASRATSIPTCCRRSRASCSTRAISTLHHRRLEKLRRRSDARPGDHARGIALQPAREIAGRRARSAAVHHHHGARHRPRRRPRRRRSRRPLRPARDHPPRREVHQQLSEPVRRQPLSRRRRLQRRPQTGRISGPACSPRRGDDYFLTAVNFDETKHYVRKVMNSYERYGEIYGNGVPSGGIRPEP